MYLVIYSDCDHNAHSRTFGATEQIREWLEGLWAMDGKKITHTIVANPPTIDEGHWVSPFPGDNDGYNMGVFITKIEAVKEL